MRLFNYLIFFVIISFLTSCLKTDHQAAGAGDAIVIIKKMGNDTVYGVSFYAYSLSSFKSVKVANSTGTIKTYNLKAAQGFKTYFYYDATETDFSKIKPLADVYKFSAVFENGVTQNFEDLLSNKVLPVPNIEKLEYDPSKNSLTVNWTKLVAADIYSISVLDGSTPVFGSLEIANTLKTYIIDPLSGRWLTGTTPVKGKIYTIRLFAIRYEDQVNAFNIQASAIGEKEVVWGN